VSALARAPFLRLLRSRASWLALGFWVAISVVPAAIDRAHAIGHGADHALLGSYSTIALPFIAFTVLSAVLGRDGLGVSGISLSNFGAPPFRVALTAVAMAIVSSAFIGGVLGAAVEIIGHGPLDPPLARDAFESLLAGALGGGAYAAFFAMGASFGARGIGRSVFLVLDWVIGADADASALLVPRAHVRSLLGGAAPLDVSGTTSIAILVGITLLFAWLACVRAARVRWNPSSHRR
jgi:hypothetical protein